MLEDEIKLDRQFAQPKENLADCFSLQSFYIYIPLTRNCVENTGHHYTVTYLSPGEPAEGGETRPNTSLLSQAWPICWAPIH
jgi:hypothetical protein